MSEQESREAKTSNTMRGLVSTKASRMTTRRSTILLASLILMYAYLPLQQEFEIRGLEYVLIGIVMAMVYTVSSGRVRTLIAMVLGLLIIILSILTDPATVDSRELTIGLYAVVGVFIGYSAILILYEVTQTQEFNYHLIVSALSAYMLLALLWAIIYTIIEIAQPGSFLVNNDLAIGLPEEPSSIFELSLYFSMITITTVGYGDITPVSPAARSIATLEPIVGQLLMTVLVAWLVGMFISASLVKREEEKNKQD
jgi:voltage-gated potassium channel